MLKLSKIKILSLLSMKKHIARMSSESQLKHLGKKIRVESSHEDSKWSQSNKARHLKVFSFNSSNSSFIRSWTEGMGIWFQKDQVSYFECFGFLHAENLGGGGAEMLPYKMLLFLLHFSNFPEIEISLLSHPFNAIHQNTKKTSITHPALSY